MASTPLFAIGQREITAAAAAAAHAAGIDPNCLISRHECGDWGDAPEWLCGENSNAARFDRFSHAMRSYYMIDAKHEFVVVTERDRSRTRLMLDTDYVTREVGVREGYAVWADSYDFPNPLVDIEESAVDRLLAGLPPIASAIDVGTGTGRLALKLARCGVADVLGLDATEEMVEVAKTKSRDEGLNGLRFAVASLGDEPLPAESNSVALVTCGLMLCHLVDVRGTIAECVRVVRPGGYILITDFHPATAAFGWRTDFIFTDGIYRLPNPPHTREDYLDGLTDTGCRLIEVLDISVEGNPYGEVTESAIEENGMPPLCLVVLGQKVTIRT